MKSFWEGLPKPFFVQAPMEDVTDAAFRTLIARTGKPHVMVTEFTSADGLVLAPETGKRAILKKLLYAEIERPIVAQLFSATPERMEKAARICAELGFDGIDINMGCPDRSVEKSGCGAALIKNAPLARQLIQAAKRGACRCASQACTSKKCLPISVKTRLGYNSDTLESWLPELLAERPACVTIHARTRKEMSDVPARWDRVAQAVAIRNAISPETLIAGNGDVIDLEDARRKAVQSGCDGVMLGRAIYGNPWLYRELDDGRPTSIIDAKTKIGTLREHIRLFDELLGDTAHFATMKKHFKAYISGWDGAKDLRVKLMETENAVDADAILANAIINA